ncbi:class I SAM-dependent methyltransferase [Halobaculum sp. D14]|uniref:class I SAM-dependent methyltransferase n=1 Tax=Halobaculum sp. D14 TaxID=3421642 RepID=UPI003EB9B49A
MTDDDRRQRAAVRDGYDAMADDYVAEREDDPTDVAVVESFLAGVDAGARVLDVGCGQGSPVLDRMPAGVDGVGLDFSAAQLAHARGRTDAALLRADMTSLPLASDAFDAATALHSVIHVPTAEHPSVFDGLARVLRPGGRLLLTAAVDDEGWAGANDDWLGGGARMEWSFPGRTTTESQLRDAGFRVDAERVVDEGVSDADEDAEWLYLTAELDGSRE